MDPIAAFAAAGIAMVVIYKTAKGRSRPAKAAGRGSRRTGGASGKLSKRSWLVQAYNSSGAPEVKSSDLSGASAEITGRAAGAVGRSTRQRWSILKSAAERSHDRRQKRWQQAGGIAPAGFRRVPKPKAKTVKPTTVTSPARPSGTAPVKPKTAAKQSTGPAPPATRHLSPVPAPTATPGATVTATTDALATATAPEAPPDWTLMIDRVASFVPEDDAALIAFMHGEAAAVVRYAEALEQARENCTNDVGLDPSAVEGFVTYSEHMSEASARMAEAYQTFVAVYGEVQALVANGVVLPNDGRWFTGNTA
jgi:hypothetical protein